MCDETFTQDTLGPETTYACGTQLTPSGFLFFAAKTQLTAGLQKRLCRFVCVSGARVVFDGNDDAALIAPNWNHLQSRVLSLSGSFQKILCVILLCDLCIAALVYCLHSIGIN